MRTHASWRRCLRASPSRCPCPVEQRDGNRHRHGFPATRGIFLLGLLQLSALPARGPSRLAPPSAPSRRAVGRSFRPTGPCPLSPLFPLFLAAFRPLSTCCPPCSSPNPLLRRPPQVRPPALPLSWTAVVGTHAFLLEALGQRPGAPDSWVRFGNHVVVFTEF